MFTATFTCLHLYRATRPSALTYDTRYTRYITYRRRRRHHYFTRTLPTNMPVYSFILVYGP